MPAFRGSGRPNLKIKGKLFEFVKQMGLLGEFLFLVQVDNHPVGGGDFIYSWGGLL